jgi:hypothetical protein
LPIWAQQVFSVAEQANFQVCFSKVVVLSVEVLSVEVELLLSELEELLSELLELLPPQATRDRLIASARASARNFFIVFPP